MDPDLLRHYTTELAHLREVGAEFAQAFPRVAARLAMNDLEVADPYVERLLEGCAFLTARVQAKLEAEQPRLIAHLLESTYPNFLAPVPSMMVARFDVDPTDPNLLGGHAIARGSALRCELPRGQGTACEFRTAHALKLWPLALADVRYAPRADDLGLHRLRTEKPVRGVLRLKLTTGGGVPFAQLAERGLDRLAVYIAAPDDIAFRLHELIAGAALGTCVVAPAAAAGPARWRDDTSIRLLGTAHDEALLPETTRGFSGHRLLQELAALPQRFLFFEVRDLAARLAAVPGTQAELVIAFSRDDAGLEPVVDAQSLALHCTPAVNLFRKRLDRIALGLDAWEYHVVPDRTRPADFEVHSLDAVTGHGMGPGGAANVQTFRPLYAATHDAPGDGAYYTARREPRRLSAREQREGTRSAYAGEEVFLSLVDAAQAPYRDDIRQLSVSAWVTNRDLPALLPAAGTAGAPAWQLDAPGPVVRVAALRGPTRPASRRPHGDVGWRYVAHLAMNHRALIDETPERAAATLRTLLNLYGPPADAAWRRQAEGVRGVEARTVTRRLPFAGPLTFGTGTAVTLDLDELAFPGASAFLLARVLRRWFARHAAITSYTQLTLVTPQRGEVMRWPVDAGTAETL